MLMYSRALGVLLDLGTFCLAVGWELKAACISQTSRTFIHTFSRSAVTSQGHMLPAARGTLVVVHHLHRTVWVVRQAHVGETGLFRTDRPVEDRQAG